MRKKREEEKSQGADETAHATVLVYGCLLFPSLTRSL